jgi:hypothetical protein
MLVAVVRSEQSASRAAPPERSYAHDGQLLLSRYVGRKVVRADSGSAARQKTCTRSARHSQEIACLKSETSEVRVCDVACLGKQARRVA